MIAIIILITVISICFFVNLNKIQKSEDSEKKEILESLEYKNYLISVDYFFSEIEYEKQNYFMKESIDKIKYKYGNTFKFFNREIFNSIDNRNILSFLSIFANLERKAKEWNEHYIHVELEKNKDLFDNIDGKSLDQQQRRAIIVDEMNELIIAGAGSGKTLTISGKVKYLVDKKGIKPEEILLISFTKKSADEMTERIKNKLGINVTSSTFHKLGLDIIKSYNEKLKIIDVKELDEIVEFVNNEEEKRDTKVVDNNLMKKVIDAYLNDELINDYEQLQNFIDLTHYLTLPEDYKQYNNLIECYENHKKLDEPTFDINKEMNKLIKARTTIKGENVRSIDEVKIANFLYLNQVEYEYERLYPLAPVGQKYYPDFYLNEYDLYLEHFGITRDYKTPQYSLEEEEKYINSIEWKRKIHNDNNTKLMETYSYYNEDGALIIELEKLLKENGVKIRRLSNKEIYDKVYPTITEKYMSNLGKKLSDFINGFKSCGYEEKDFDTLLEASRKINVHFIKQRNIIFLTLAREIYNRYQGRIKKDCKIDFNDMINTSRKIIEKGDVEVDYKYIIIDEYQDISYSRYRLIDVIREKTNAKIMCVGDDWQSIYRFSGSNINLFTNFEEYFEPCEKLSIEKTYRNSQELINIAGKFVMMNEKQSRKELRSHKSVNIPIEIIYYNSPFCKSREDKRKKEGKAISETFGLIIDKIVEESGIDSSIKILYRYSDSYEKIRQGMEYAKEKYPKLKLKHMTIHKSKGLEADNVVVIDLEDDMKGFPSQIPEDSVMKLVLPLVEKYEYADERRLFYVAITRTKNKTYLIVPDNNPSIFINELKNYCSQEAIFYYNGKEILRPGQICPKCGGYMRVAHGIYGRYFKCIDKLCGKTKSIKITNNKAH